MAADETPLEMAMRHVREQEAAIAKQKKIIARLREIGQPADLAEQVLDSMERKLEITRSEVRRYSNSDTTRRINDFAVEQSKG